MDVGCRLKSRFFCYAHHANVSSGEIENLLAVAIDFSVGFNDVGKNMFPSDLLWCEIAGHADFGKEWIASRFKGNNEERLILSCFDKHDSRSDDGHNFLS